MPETRQQKKKQSSEPQQAIAAAASIRSDKMNDNSNEETDIEGTKKLPAKPVAEGNTSGESPECEGDRDKGKTAETETSENEEFNVPTPDVAAAAGKPG